MPLALRPVIGSREFIQSLATQSADEAEPIALELAAMTKRLFYEMRSAMAVDLEKLKARAREKKLELEISDRREEIETLRDQHAAEIRTLKANFKKNIELTKPRLRTIIENAHLKGKSEALESVSARLGRGTEHTTESVTVTSKRGRVPLIDLFDGWAKERKPRQKTVDSWRSRVQAFIEFVGHDNASKITADDAVRWKDELVSKGLATKTVNEGYLAALHKVAAYGLKNKKLPANPFDGVKVLTTKDEEEDSKWAPFTDADAAVLLSEARKWSGWRKWVPFVCAYSGARVEEVAGAAAADIRCQEGIHYIDLHQKSRKLKNKVSVRRVPLHSALIEEGLLDYVNGLPVNGPLFPDALPDKYGKRGAGISKILGRWLRKVGIADPRKVPNHSWRHRFADLCREHDVPLDVRFALDGHSMGNVGNDYGAGFKLATLAKEIAKLPKQG